MKKETHMAFKSFRRDELKRQGRIHLPVNKVIVPKNIYKRKKHSKYDNND